MFKKAPENHQNRRPNSLTTAANAIHIVICLLFLGSSQASEHHSPQQFLLRLFFRKRKEEAAEDAREEAREVRREEVPAEPEGGPGARRRFPLDQEWLLAVDLIEGVAKVRKSDA